VSALVAIRPAVALLLFAAACGSSRTSSNECARDDECALVTTEDRGGMCCSICEARAMPRAAGEKQAAWCRAHWGPDHAAHCPRLDCPTAHRRASCESGRCVVTASGR